MFIVPPSALAASRATSTLPKFYGTLMARLLKVTVSEVPSSCSLLTLIHNTQQPKLRNEAGLGSKNCTILMGTAECSLVQEAYFAACLFHTAFTNNGHPTVELKTLEISDSSKHSCHSSNLQARSTQIHGLLLRRGRTLSAFHDIVLHLSKGLPHCGTSTFRSLAKGLLERPLAPLAPLGAA